MEKVGIICEYNPFHNGHIYHINTVKGMFPNAKIVLVMSGNFTESGNVSLLDKWTKTELALTYGVDLVLELPFPFANESADTFAMGAIKILNEMDVNYLVFGSESDNIDLLIDLANIELDPEFDEVVKKYIDTGISYPMAVNFALNHFKPFTALAANDVLGLTYVREIIKSKSKIIPYTIKRTNDFNSTHATTNIASARSVRKLLQKNSDVKKYVPSNTYNKLKEGYRVNDDYFELLKYKIISSKDLSCYLGVDEGIENRILKYINTANSLDELIMKVKTKRFTYNKLARMFTHILCDYTKEESKSFKKMQYIRVLGFNKYGREILKDRKDKTTIPILTAYKKGFSMLELETRITNIYNMNNQDTSEHTKKPIIFE